MNNLPIYRAKKLGSDDYEIGFLLNNMIVTAYEQEVKIDGIYWKSITTSKIDPTTLAIHFPDMTDSQGNKIFASLSEDGKGGDIIERNGMTFKTIYKSVNGRFEAYEVDGMHHLLAHKFHQSQVIGIQK